jgi:6-phosphogluconate dehydrogenase
MSKADIGIIGLGVMGHNLAQNMARHGFSVVATDRSSERLADLERDEAWKPSISICPELEAVVRSLKTPRTLLIMVPAGSAVDDLMTRLLPLLERGDVLIDGGNSHYLDTIRRSREMAGRGLHFVGMGVSGGEQGALHGPSLMPGGAPEAWRAVQPIFQKIAARTDAGEPCCEWVGEDGAGHFVKMVHNGIEYGDMQMIAEVYHFMKAGLGLSNDTMHDAFASWNKGPLNSYLIEITSHILSHRSPAGDYVVDQILDVAGQKGTGKWTAATALDLGQPLTLIGESVFARYLSALKEERVAAARILRGPEPSIQGTSEQLMADLESSLYASKIVSYAQGYQLMRAAAQEFGWNLNYGGIAQIWRGGCIIRSIFLDKIREAYDTDPDLRNLMLAPFFKEAIHTAQAGWRRVVQAAVERGIPMPAMGAALAYFDAYRHARLPANLLQAQRDYFGAHTYERLDRPRGEFFHTNWTASDIGAATSLDSPRD